MSHPKDLLTSLERQRVQLEQQISDLQQSLYKWRIWDAEYDGLKEELSALNDNSTKEDILRVAKDFGGSLVTDNEIKNLLGEAQGVNRSQRQVIDMIGRRVDYVRDNIRALEKRVGTAEERLVKILAVEQPGGDVNEEGLSMMDIVEELDDEGRVISGSVTTPGKSAEEILEVLKKAGVKDLLDGNIEESKTVKEAEKKRVSEDNGSVNVAVSANEKNTTTQRPVPKRVESEVTAGSVSNQTTVGSDLSNQSGPGKAHGEGDISMMEIDESPEDAAFRKEILQYGLEGVGAVVAELEFDESASEFSISDEEYDDYAMSDEDEEEDEYGRTTRRVLSDDYHRQMRELEKKLNAQSIHNIGPDTSVLPPEIRQELEGHRLKHEAGTNEGKPLKKKKVAFADELDIAQEPLISPSETVHPENTDKTKAPEIPAIQDVVMEHTSTPQEAIASESKPRKKQSRFKNARAGEGRSVPEHASVLPPPNNPQNTRSSSHSKTPPPKLPLFPARPSDPKPFSQPIKDPDDSAFSNSSTIANKVVERSVDHSSARPADPDDDFDEALLKRETATEYYKLRNRKIQQEGGFMQQDEDEAQILSLEDESCSNAPRKRVSLFKSARVKGNVGK